MQKYNPCGIFLDIISPKVCYCEKCVADMKTLGLDIKSEKDRLEFAEITEGSVIDVRQNGDIIKINNHETKFYYADVKSEAAPSACKAALEKINMYDRTIFNSYKTFNRNFERRQKNVTKTLERKP